MDKKYLRIEGNFCERIIIRWKNTWTSRGEGWGRGYPQMTFLVIWGTFVSTFPSWQGLTHPCIGSLVDGSSLLVPIGLRRSWLPGRRKEGTYGLDLVAFSLSNMYDYKCYKCWWWNFEHFSLRSNMNWSAPCVGIMHLAPPLRAGRGVFWGRRHNSWYFLFYQLLNY